MGFMQQHDDELNLSGMKILGLATPRIAMVGYSAGMRIFQASTTNDSGASHPGYSSTTAYQKRI